MTTKIDWEAARRAAIVRKIVAACASPLGLSTRDVERSMRDDDSIIVRVSDDDPNDGEGEAEAVRHEIATALGDGWTVRWTGNSNTDADGYTTSDLSITPPTVEVR